jgi:aerobic C4-dicarboxylate transport protein
MATTNTSASTKVHKILYVQVIIGILIGIALGFFNPHFAETMKPLGDGFIKLIRMMIAPIIFLTVVSGIASIGDMKKVGRVGLKALLYFEVVTTMALLIGLIVVSWVKPGAGINANAATLDVKAIAQYTTSGASLSTTDFVLNIIPDTFINAFAKGEILQVLLLAILFGFGVGHLPGGQKIIDAVNSLTHVTFNMISYIMRLAPIGAFGAMAFTIGKYGIKTLVSLGTVIVCMYITSFFFVFVVLGLIAKAHKFSVWKLIRYIKEELLIVLGTSTSESALPRLMQKLEYLGCSKSVVGLVVPSGYSFNLDGTSIYLTIAALFVAQATNTQLTGWQEFQLLVVLMLTSKGAAAVTGGGFITLAATLSSLHTVPVAGITLLLGIDRFMSEMRGLTNIVGNAVATVIVAKWEKEFDAERAERVFNGDPAAVERELLTKLHAPDQRPDALAPTK